jgi:hypothetical protein
VVGSHGKFVGSLWHAQAKVALLMGLRDRNSSVHAGLATSSIFDRQVLVEVFSMLEPPPPPTPPPAADDDDDCDCEEDAPEHKAQHQAGLGGAGSGSGLPAGEHKRAGDGPLAVITQPAFLGDDVSNSSSSRLHVDPLAPTEHNSAIEDDEGDAPASAPGQAAADIAAAAPAALVVVDLPTDVLAPAAVVVDVGAAAGEQLPAAELAIGADAAIGRRPSEPVWHSDSTGPAATADAMLAPPVVWAAGSGGCLHSLSQQASVQSDASVV